jgi:hypothetical protein
MPSTDITDTDPFPVTASARQEKYPFTCNPIHMFSLRIMGRVKIYLMILMGSTHLKIYLMMRSNQPNQSIWRSMK